MRIGPETYHWQDIRSAGVPRGGRFGRPRAMAKKLKPFGIFIAWSDIYRCFDIYTRGAGGKFIMQWRCTRGMEPFPLCDAFAELMIFLKHEQGKTQSVESLLLYYKRQQAQREYEREVEKQATRDMMRNDVMRATDLRMKWRTPMESITVPDMTGMN